MRRPNDDEIRGKIDEAAGTVKENIGRASGDINLENEGADQRCGGKVEGGLPLRTGGTCKRSRFLFPNAAIIRGRRIWPRGAGLEFDLEPAVVAIPLDLVLSQYRHPDFVFVHRNCFAGAIETDCHVCHNSYLSRLL